MHIERCKCLNFIRPSAKDKEMHTLLVDPSRFQEAVFIRSLTKLNYSSTEPSWAHRGWSEHKVLIIKCFLWTTGQSFLLSLSVLVYMYVCACACVCAWVCAYAIACACVVCLCADRCVIMLQVRIMQSSFPPKKHINLKHVCQVVCTERTFRCFWSRSLHLGSLKQSHFMINYSRYYSAAAPKTRTLRKRNGVNVEILF